MHVIGTAGHVDHGKSTLVEALTGTHPDRLKEEREREMTIDLGFAALDLPQVGRVGVIDVPGHRDFIENMLAGVGGIDAALFVVAADEGVMPQTREHLAILDLLQVQGGVIALTKVDLVPDVEWLALVQADLAQALAGTVLAGAPCVPVSARTGVGLDALRAALEAHLVHAPARRDRGRPRLPVDRVFTMAGFGTVVTGTLSDGRIAVGDELELAPRGVAVRVRGLQSHGAKLDVAWPGSRVAVNLAGVSVAEVRRGDVLAQSGALPPTELIDVQLRVLADVPRALTHNAEVKFFCGAAEIVGTVRLLGADSLAAGATGWAQVRLAAPAAVAAGERFIVRLSSPAITLGGGRVVDAHPVRRHRRFKADIVARLELLARGTPEELVVQAVERAGWLGPAAAWAAASADAAQGSALIGALVAQGALVRWGDEASGVWLCTPAGWAQCVEQCGAYLREYHAAHPLRAGMPREELKSRLKLDGRVFSAVLGGLSAQGYVALTPDPRYSGGGSGAGVHWADFSVRFSAAQQRQVDALLAQCREEPMNTPAVKDVVTALGLEVYQVLLERGVLVQAAPDVFFLAETYADLVARVRAHIHAHGAITVAQARDVFATSRKYVLALLEHLDQQGVTVRRGDERVLRRGVNETARG